MCEHRAADIGAIVKIAETTGTTAQAIDSVDDALRRAEEMAAGGSVVVSDGFFPFRDGVDAAISEGVSGIIQPGGSERDFEVIEACNESNVTMVFTGQRLFKH